MGFGRRDRFSFSASLLRQLANEEAHTRSDEHAADEEDLCEVREMLIHRYSFSACAVLKKELPQRLSLWFL